MTEIQKYVKGMAAQMDSSAICLTIFTKDFHMATDGLLQFAVCCMLDKPLFLLVPEGVRIPESVKKIAVAIEYFKPGNQESMHSASRKLLSEANSKGFTA